MGLHRERAHRLFFTAWLLYTLLSGEQQTVQRAQAQAGWHRTDCCRNTHLILHRLALVHLDAVGLRRLGAQVEPAAISIRDSTLMRALTGGSCPLCLHRQSGLQQILLHRGLHQCSGMQPAYCYALALLL